MRLDVVASAVLLAAFLLALASALRCLASALRSFFEQDLPH